MGSLQEQLESIRLAVPSLPGAKKEVCKGRMLPNKPVASPHCHRTLLCSASLESLQERAVAVEEGVGGVVVVVAAVQQTAAHVRT